VNNVASLTQSYIRHRAHFSLANAPGPLRFQTSLSAISNQLSAILVKHVTERTYSASSISLLLGNGHTWHASERNGPRMQGKRLIGFNTDWDVNSYLPEPMSPDSCLHPTLAPTITMGSLPFLFQDIHDP
jgi:hypothetical protein